LKEFRSSGVQEFRSSGVQEFRSSGVQEFRSSGVQEFRSSGWDDITKLRAKPPAIGELIFTEHCRQRPPELL
jgi:hypothetical protein